MNDPTSSMQHPIPKTVVLGLGNPILTDDGVAIYVVRAAADRSTLTNGATFVEASVGGLRLLDLLEGYDRAILVDAIKTREGQPGNIYWLCPSDIQGSLHSGSTHDLSLPAALDLGRRLGMRLPGDDNLAILAIEVEDVLTVGEACTPAVTKAIPRAVEAVWTELKEWR